MEGQKFLFVDTPVREKVRAWLDRFAGPVQIGVWVECQLGAGEWMQAMRARIEAGALLIIDYGELAENLSHRRAAGTLRTYRAHHLGPDPLDEPGVTDITSDVNLSALMAVADTAGWSTELWRQDDFLEAWGLRERLRDLRRQELDLSGDNEELSLQLRSQRIDGETLLHERGLGDFRVLVARSARSGRLWHGKRRYDDIRDTHDVNDSRNAGLGDDRGS